jgi:hypothetical protein
VHNPQNAVRYVVNYTKQFIARTNRHQTYFSTLEDQAAPDNTVRLADAFLTALNAKKTKAACKALYDRPWKQELLFPFATSYLRPYLRW